jgi:hypothetical protein
MCLNLFFPTNGSQNGNKYENSNIFLSNKFIFWKENKIYFCTLEKKNKYYILILPFAQNLNIISNIIDYVFCNVLNLKERGYWQELIESIIWAHNKLRVAPAI